MFHNHTFSKTQGDSSPRRGQEWWRSLDELSNTEEFQAYLHREFPENASEWLSGSRRDFLRLMGASLFLAGVAGCDLKQPMETIVPTVRSGGHAKPGMPLYFTTAMDFGGSAVGLTVQSRDGRPIKIEGNANHPASLGATGVFAQAATLDLYDPDRARTPLQNGKIVTREKLVSELASLRATLDSNGGEGLRILIGTSTSPTLQRLLGDITQRWPKSKWLVYEAFNDDNVRAGMKLAFGNEADLQTPIYDLAAADIVLSIDHDFLAARDLPPSGIREFADARRIAGNDRSRDERRMIRLYHLGSTPTPTAAKADHQLALPPSEIQTAMFEVARQLGVDLPADQPTVSDRSSGKPLQDSHVTQWISQVVADLKAAGSRGVVMTGRDQAPALHALAHAINNRLGAIGHVIRFTETPQVRPAESPSDVTMLAELTADMRDGAVSQLFVLGGNPVFDAPGDIDFGSALSHVPFSLTLANSSNETSAVSQWLVPRSHFLESWGDARSYDGTASIVQPLISPLYESFSEIELLGELLQDSPSGYASVRKTWQEQLGQGDDSAPWQLALSQGIIPKTSGEGIELSLRPSQELAESLAAAIPEVDQGATADGELLGLVIKPDPSTWDGRFLNNGWLQELPKPLSHVVWDNTAWIAPSDASRLQLSNGDLVRIMDGPRAVEIAVWIVPGHAKGCLTLFAGYGRKHVGRVGAETGFNVQPLKTSLAMTSSSQGLIRKLHRKRPIVSTQHHQLMEGRDLARSGTLMEYREHRDAPEFAHPPTPSTDDTFYEPWPDEGKAKWGMTIDLTSCVGCSACVIACQAENNIPVVGKQQCGMNRHMHWIRVDTYYQGSPEHPDRTLNQPVPCMHCEMAPCEVVCPVAATNHSDEGLNQMVYNRCVGTRYCSNNCPYKVRRFNFLDYSDHFIDEPSLQLLSNPEVTMRSRGVMEKCTYCVQRIELARIGAQLQDRNLQDGDILTACQAACPAQAIRFGDLNDPKSEVRTTADHPLNYALLEELNTKPRTTYLADVYNPSSIKGPPDERSEEVHG